MFAAGSMRPEWCFVAEEEEDRPLGRVAFWTLLGMEESFALVLLDVPWDGDYMDVGTRLLGDVLNEARRLDARRVKHEPSWWRLAYAPNGELVGLVMPAEPPAFLTVFYVGVAPQMRGRGYVDDLLAAGSATLLEVRDVANAPMAAAFERAGWARFAGRREYGVDLTSDRA